MNDKSKLEKQETEFNSQIYDYQIRQVEVTQVIKEQNYVAQDMRADIENLKEMIEAKRNRKQKLQEKVSEKTRDFVDQVVSVSKELEETQNEVLQWKEHKDKFMNLTAILERERTNGSYKYANSIEDMIERAEALEKANDELHSVLEQFGSRL